MFYWPSPMISWAATITSHTHTHANTTVMLSVLDTILRPKEASSSENLIMVMRHRSTD